jgi:ABC-type multidrug transport system permease subunit
MTKKYSIAILVAPVSLIITMVLFSIFGGWIWFTIFRIATVMYLLLTVWGVYRIWQVSRKERR